MFVDEVAQAVREVGMAEVVPRFRALADGDITEKSPGDLVTIADQECERVLTQRLQAILDIPVVGEEATAENPALLDLVDGADACWVIDPVDGTSNFVAGDPNHVVMVALVERGESSAAWVWHPESDAMLTAQKGAGTKRNGSEVVAPKRGTAKGIVKRRYMPEPARTLLADFPESVGLLVPALGSAGIEYGSLISGDIDFLCYWRTMPWDHAPGGLLAAEAGLRVGRIDGSAYRPGDGRSGLLAATHELWDAVATEITNALTS